MERVELRTRRLVLTAPGPDDVDTITALCQDADVQRWTTVPSPYDREHAVGFVAATAQKWHEGTSLTWALRAAAGSPAPAVLGMVGLHDIDDGEAEIGYWLGRPHRGAALMAEAVDAVCGFGFRELALQRITWHAFIPNVGSASVARAAGFRFEGTVRLGAPQRGVRRDEWQAGLLADDVRPGGTDAATGWPAESFGVQGAST